MTECVPERVIELWDGGMAVPALQAPVYRWNGYEEAGTVHSLLRYVDRHDVQLRRKYLRWIHELGETRIGGYRVIELLARGDGLSHWWLTLLVEQSPWKSPAIMDALRLFALEEILRQQGAQKLRVTSASRTLCEALRQMCSNLGIACDVARPPAQASPRRSLRNLYRALPYRARAMITLSGYLLGRWPLRRAGKADWIGGDRALLLCSYFFHLDEKSCAQGRFYSRYWEGLPELLRASGYCPNWLQLYLQSNVVPSARFARNWVARFNKQRMRQGFHCFLDSYLSWGVVFRVLRRWQELAAIHRRLGDMRVAFRPDESCCSLWPIMQSDWHDSLLGPAAVSNLLWAELFDEAMRDLPPQKMGLYLCENQAWERAMIHAWRKHGHGRLVAVAHSTVRFWDLRYFKDPRTIRSQDSNPLPQPDLIALNDRAAVEAFRAAGHPADAIVECEALRYGYLNALRGAPAKAKAQDGRVDVLILGDYWRASTERMLRLLERALPHVSRPASYTLKPHPNCPVEAADFPALHLEISNEPLATILPGFDLAYSSNLTSAAVDAYVAGLTVVVMLDANELNFSPLRGRSGVRFVSEPAELDEALQARGSHPAEVPGESAFFFLDPDFPRWKRLLATGAGEKLSEDTVIRPASGER